MWEVRAKMWQKWRKKRVWLVIRRGSYLRPPWTVLAEILGDNSPIVGLSCVWISLGCDEAGGSSGWKRPKNGPKNQFFEKVPSSYRGEIFLYRTQILPIGPRWSRKNFSFVKVFWDMARSDIHFDMQCGRTRSLLYGKEQWLGRAYIIMAVLGSTMYVSATNFIISEVLLELLDPKS